MRGLGPAGAVSRPSLCEACLTPAWHSPHVAVPHLGVPHTRTCSSVSRVGLFVASRAVVGPAVHFRSCPTPPCPRTRAVAYMAPECFRPETRGITCAADIFSLGCMLWECLTGQRPWAGMSSWVIIYQVGTWAVVTGWVGQREGVRCMWVARRDGAHKGECSPLMLDGRLE